MPCIGGCHAAQKGPYASKSALWQELCQAHGMTKVQSIAVKNLADALQMEPAAMVFTRPEVWETDRLPAELAGESKLYANLRETLFENASVA
ncbi:MAG: hypothetical protein QM811_27790 [Pirellulales bacterium]